MPGKSPKTRYGEFRVFVEWRRRGKWAVRPEFVPSVAAWLLMIGKRYEKMAAGLRDRHAVDSVPALAAAAASLDVCIGNIQRLLNLLTENFDNDDWQPAVADICRLMNIRPTSEPLPEVPPGQFEHLICEVAPDAPDARGAGEAVHVGAATDAPQPDAKPRRKRR